MPSSPYTLLDVFTATPLEGNPLAVVHAADGLDDETMLGFARETRLSETSFIQSPGVEGADYRNRIWMTTGEIPFAGHPSLGAAVAEARRRGIRSGRLTQRTGAGLQPIDLEVDGNHARASMLQQPPEFLGEPEAARAFRAAGLDPSAADPYLRVELVATGVPQLLVPVAGAEALAAARPDAAVLGPLLAELGSVVLYLVLPDPGAGRARARSFFVDAAGVALEDPATGAAAGPLCALLAARADVDRVEIAQGVEMGRPSLLRAEVEGDRVRVGGDAIVIVEGTLSL